MCRLLGNSMASNALLRVTVPLIRAIRPEIDVHDPWSNGHAQRMLRKSAQAPNGTCDEPRYDSPEPKEATDSLAPAVHGNAEVRAEVVAETAEPTTQLQNAHARLEFQFPSNQVQFLPLGLL